MSEVPMYPLIINGERCEPLSGEYADVINPADGQVVGRAALGNAADVDAAVTAARAAFNDRAWRNMPPVERSKVLYQCAQLVMANAQELIELEVSCPAEHSRVLEEERERVLEHGCPAVGSLSKPIAVDINVIRK